MTLTPVGRLTAAVAALLAGTFGLFAIVNLSGLHLPPLAHLALMLPPAAVALWLAGRYWGGIDEVAREAQKDAYFWGGSFGALVGFVGMAAAVAADLTPVMPKPGQVFMLGAIVIILSQLAGFGLAWALWWARRR